jgi:hypothetical protein
MPSEPNAASRARWRDSFFMRISAGADVSSEAMTYPTGVSEVVRITHLRNAGEPHVDSVNVLANGSVIEVAASPGSDLTVLTVGQQEKDHSFVREELDREGVAWLIQTLQRESMIEVGTPLPGSELIGLTVGEQKVGLDREGVAWLIDTLQRARSSWRARVKRTGTPPLPKTGESGIDYGERRTIRCSLKRSRRGRKRRSTTSRPGCRSPSSRPSCEARWSLP